MKMVGKSADQNCMQLVFYSEGCADENEPMSADP